MTLSRNLFIALGFSFLLLIPSLSEAVDYIIDDGKSFQTIHDDPKSQNLVVLEWQIRLYKKGDPVGSRKNWGLISGSSLAIVSANLKAKQEFEKAYARWAHKDADAEIFTFLNPYGPIAVLKKDSAIPDRASRVLETIERVTKQIKFINRIVAVINLTHPQTDGKKAIDLNALGFGGPGSSLLKLADDLASALKKANELAARVDRIQEAFGWSEFDQGMADIEHQISDVDLQLQKIKTGLSHDELRLLEAPEADQNLSWQFKTETWEESGRVDGGWLKWTGRALDGTLVEDWKVRLADIDPDPAKTGIGGGIPPEIQFTTRNHKNSAILNRKGYVRTSKRLSSDVTDEQDHGRLRFASAEEAEKFLVALQIKLRNSSFSETTNAQ